MLCGSLACVATVRGVLALPGRGRARTARSAQCWSSAAASAPRRSSSCRHGSGRRASERHRSRWEEELGKTQTGVYCLPIYSSVYIYLTLIFHLIAKYPSICLYIYPSSILSRFLWSVFLSMYVCWSACTWWCTMYPTISNNITTDDTTSFTLLLVNCALYVLLAPR